MEVNHRLFFVGWVLIAICVAGGIAFVLARWSIECDARCGRRESTITGGRCYCLEPAP